MKFVQSMISILGMLQVVWSDGEIKSYDLVELGCEWFRMSNDDFYQKYGFNFNPHKYPGLYEKCKDIIFPQN